MHDLRVVSEVHARGAFRLEQILDLDDRSNSLDPVPFRSDGQQWMFRIVGYFIVC